MTARLKLRATADGDTLLVQGGVGFTATAAGFTRRGDTVLDRLEDLQTYNAALGGDDAEERAELLDRAWWTIRDALYPA